MTEQQQKKFNNVVSLLNNIDTFFFLVILLSIVSLISTPFVWIWGTFVIAFKIFLSAIVAIAISSLFRLIMKESIKKIKAEHETK